MHSVVKAVAFAIAAFAVSGCVTMRPPADLGAGDWVLARWQPEDPFYYPAIVTDRQGDELSLQYDDGDTGVQPARNVRRFDWRAGTRLECRWSNGGWYPGVITQLASNRVNLDIRYDDGDTQSTTTSECRDR